MTVDRPVKRRHVWVSGAGGYQRPGLVIAWRRAGDSGWEAYVPHLGDGVGRDVPAPLRLLAPSPRRRRAEPPVQRTHRRAYSPVNKSVFVYRFGSWPAALAAAGLTVAPRGRYHTDGALAANLRTVITVHGRTPRLSEMDCLPSTITSKTYRDRYGTLEQARRTLNV